MTEGERINLREAALSMGYRKVRPDVDAWGKPFGYSLLLIHKVGNLSVVDQWYKGVDQKIHLFNSQDINFDEMQVGTIISQLKEFETWDVRQEAPTHDTNFEFLTHMYQIEDLLGGTR